MSNHWEPIAIIGMSGRFPGAMTLDQFWDNLANGVDSIERIPDAIIDSRRDPRGDLPANFVPMGSYLAETELFDHHFFGLSLRDAKLMDPQQRLFIEYAWTAVEDAGYSVDQLGDRVAVYGGGGPSRHVLDALDAFGHDYGTMFEVVATGVANAMVMRTSFLFDFTGESIYLYTACSTSLAAIDLACRALIDGRADVALAGGTALWLPQQEGYEHVEGMILSRDGRCRAFDAGASGTIWGNGVAVLVLKPLAQALRDRDHVRAVIAGSGVNNDGRRSKLSFAAPSADGQAGAVRAAYDNAGISPASVTYVEAHGTGTVVGDPLEVEGLHMVFGKGAGPSTCALGSVKTNIGHLDPVAGAASLIKTVLALEHRQIPPSLHFETPNPAIDFAAGPFFVNTELRPWEPRDGVRRAGVNSFGVGGTNVHVIVEEAPEPAPSAPSLRPRHLVTLSARSDKALSRTAAELKEHLRAHPDLDVADVAFTRNVGRRHFELRTSVVAADTGALIRALEAPPPAVRSGPRQDARVVFLFPGQGAQAVDMARELYRAEPAFRQDVDDCAEVLAELIDHDIRELVYPDDLDSDRRARAEDQLAQTAITQPVLFTIEFALARQWMRWGVEPAAMLGHSVGEYVAACLAGVFEPADALTLIAARGRLIQDTRHGAMVAVTASERDVTAMLEPGLDLAALNGPMQCVVSGPVDLIEAFERRLAERDMPGFRLRTSHAFHSAMLDDVLAPFEQLVGDMALHAPQIPFISNVTGTWIQPEQATDPGYWAQHMRRAVRFWDGVTTLRQAGHALFVEVGPGHTLTRILAHNPAPSAPRAPAELACPSLRHPRQADSDYDHLLRALGALWARRVPVDWSAFYQHESRRRLSLPHYSFDKVWCALYEPGEEFKLVQQALGAQRLANPLSGATAHETRAPDPTAGIAAPASQPGAASLPDVAEPGEPEERPDSYYRPYVEPSGDIETRIAELFARSLGIRAIGADDDLMELGGHSLMLVAITNHLRAMFDVNVSMRAVIENPTPRLLAVKIEELRASGDRADSDD